MYVLQRTLMWLGCGSNHGSGSNLANCQQPALRLVCASVQCLPDGRFSHTT